MYVVGLLGTLVGVIYNFLMLLAVQKTYSVSEVSGYANADKVSGIMNAINADWLNNNAATAFAGAVLYGSWANWYAYQSAGIDAANAAAASEESSEEAPVEEAVVEEVPAEGEVAAEDAVIAL